MFLFDFYQRFLDHGVNGEILCEISESDLAFVPIKSRAQRDVLMSKIAEFRKRNEIFETSASSSNRKTLHHAGSGDSLDDEEMDTFHLGPKLEYWDTVEVAMFLEEIGMEKYQKVCLIFVVPFFSSHLPFEVFPYFECGREIAFSTQ